MTQTEEQKEPDEQPQETEVPTRQGPSLWYRFRSAVHKLFPRLIEHPRTAKSRAHYKSRDPEENAKSTPPDDEFIDLRCIWAVEFYTPAHVEELLAAFRKLGWVSLP